MVVMRVIPIDIPNFEALRLPPVLSASRTPSAAWCSSRA
jgi:Tfp pilus assembly pilus retraction ATPase PilT